jgi:predicted small secreted protein
MTPTTDLAPSATRVFLRRLLALIVLSAIGAAIAACSTTEGFGKDVKNLGGGIEDSAARNK